jgi:hypothetical protein
MIPRLDAGTTKQAAVTARVTATEYVGTCERSIASVD